MPRGDYANCRGCGRTREEAGPLSRSRLCTDCSGDILAENVLGISLKTGPAFERQRVGMIAQALGVTKVMAHRLLQAANGVDDLTASD